MYGLIASIRNVDTHLIEGVPLLINYCCRVAQKSLRLSLL
ncbi:hypothetical protein S7335_3744 [Synechococcus sp. PCC 7335]|nr:hypothetical protein S7335_3744 [Synechococcus sp. PCC 7335]